MLAEFAHSSGLVLAPGQMFITTCVCQPENGCVMDWTGKHTVIEKY